MQKIFFKIKSNRKIKVWILLLVMVFSSLSSAQEQKKSDKRRTSINFEDELVQGEVKKPELLYLLQKKQFNFKRLIRLRENFLPEMRRTAEDIQPGRGDD